MQRFASTLALALLAGTLASAQDEPAETPAPAEQEDQSDVLVVRGTLHLGDGPALADGAVVLRDGKVTAAGPWAEVSFPQGARVAAPKGAHISPGLVEATSFAGVSGTYAEQGSEVVPHLRVLPAVDRSSRELKRLARQGVTTLFVPSDPSSVIGSQGCLLKANGRVLERAGAISATLGPESWQRGGRNRPPFGSPTHLTRRPNTLMGNVWVFREAFYSAKQAAEPTPAQATLREVLQGERPLRIRAGRRGAIEAALRLAAEQGLRFTLEQASEVHHVLDLIQRAQVPVIYGPMRLEGEVDSGPSPATPRLLRARKIPFCLTAGGGEGEAGLWAQALWATRYGLAPARALEAVTAAPARILGAASQVGRLAPGLDADLVVWSGAPLSSTTRPLAVLIDGKPVHGKLAAKAAAEAKQGKAPTPRRRF